MFKKFKKKSIFSPTDGKIVELSQVPDPVFAQKLLGDGFAVIPTDNGVYAPVDGEIVDVTDTLHAYCIKSDDGAELLIHIGIDTVKLGGEGFEAAVKSGDRVSVGDLLCRFEPQCLKSAGCDSHIPVIVTNYDEMKSLDIKTGKKARGEICAEYSI